jgi:hypothetical protein
MMKRGAAVALMLAAAVAGEARAQDLTEIPLRIDGGRLIVQVDDDQGGKHDFILGVGYAWITESGAAALAGRSLSLGGVDITLDHHETVPDDALAHAGSTHPVGVVGGWVLTQHDILIDAPNGRMLIKPAGRSVRWPGHSLTSPVSVQILHDYLLRLDVQVGDGVYDSLLDLSPAVIQLSPPLGEEQGIEDGTIDSFRLGYSGWPSVPVEVTVTPTSRGWGAESRGVVIGGAPIALDCALAISWRHAEVRTCIR